MRILLFAVVTMTLCLPLGAAEVRSDMLAGLGDFEYASDTAWSSGHVFSSQERTSEDGWCSDSDAHGWSYGFKPATPDDSVAVGWVRKSGSEIVPSKHLVCRIESGKGIRGSNCQYVGVRRFTGPKGAIVLSSQLRVDDRNGSVHPGDRLAFHVEQMRLSGLEDLPALSKASCQISIKLGDESYVEDIRATSDQVSGTVFAGPVPPGAKSVTVNVTLRVSGGTGNAELGLFLDGARVWAQRGKDSEYAVDDFGVADRRTIRTFRIFVDPRKHSIRDVSQNYDYVMLQMDQDYTCIPQLRYYNPDIKVLMYASCRVYKWLDSRGNDAYFSNSPLGFESMKSEHSELLHSNGTGDYVRSVGLSNSYYARVADPEYALLWAQALAAKASSRRYDGVFIDDVAATAGIRADMGLVRPSQEAWEFQEFLHTAVPVLRAKNLEIVQNGATYHLAFGDGQVYLDPFWKPEPERLVSGYVPNAPGTVADALFQEWAFFLSTGEGTGQRNRYDYAYWKQCLDDMDTVKQWNENLRETSTSPKQMYHAFVLGNDHPDDPAAGADGWLQFGLTSYLLGQNQYTTFGWDVRPGYLAPYDFSITGQLGVPAGKYQMYHGDVYVCYRLYQPLDNVGAGGVVVVNAHPKEPRTFRVDFNAVDESGASIRPGSDIVLKPHTGRILLRESNNWLERSR